MVGVDLGNTPIKDFTTLKPDIEEATASQLPQILLPEEEGLQNDKPNTTKHPHTIPKYILPTQHRPTHHRLDLTRAIEVTLNTPTANSSLVTRETLKRAFKRLNGTQLNIVRYGT